MLVPSSPYMSIVIAALTIHVGHNLVCQVFKFEITDLCRLAAELALKLVVQHHYVLIEYLQQSFIPVALLSRSLPRLDRIPRTKLHPCRTTFQKFATALMAFKSCRHHMESSASDVVPGQPHLVHCMYVAPCWSLYLLPH